MQASRDGNGSWWGYLVDNQDVIIFIHHIQWEVLHMLNRVFVIKINT